VCNVLADSKLRAIVSTTWGIISSSTRPCFRISCAATPTSSSNLHSDESLGKKRCAFVVAIDGDIRTERISGGADGVAAFQSPYVLNDGEHILRAYAVDDEGAKIFLHKILHCSSFPAEVVKHFYV
jgi:hypothetical protein